MSDTIGAPGSTLATGAGLGRELRDARLRLGWELPLLSDSLRIRQSYLEAIEAGSIAELPGPTYALGFVRAYASALGLPGEEMARRFRAEAMQADAKPALSFPSPVPQRGVPAGAVILLGLVILAGAYGGWYWVTGHRTTPTETVPPIPDRLTTPSPAKPAPSPQVASLLPATAPPVQRPAPAATPASGGPDPAIAPPAARPVAPPPVQPTAQPPVSHAAPTAAPPASSPASQSSAPPAASSTQAAGLPAGTRILIKAGADAWVTVKQKSGPPLLNKLMHAGDSWPVPASQAGLTLTTGNAGGTSVEVDGAPIPVALGSSGMVRRDLPLDADMLKSGQLPVQVRRPKAALAQ